MAVSELPGNPNAVWTVKIQQEGELCISDLRLSFSTVSLQKREKFKNNDRTLLG